MKAMLTIDEQTSPRKGNRMAKKKKPNGKPKPKSKLSRHTFVRDTFATREPGAIAPYDIFVINLSDWNVVFWNTTDMKESGTWHRVVPPIGHNCDDEDACFTSGTYDKLCALPADQDNSLYIVLNKSGEQPLYSAAMQIRPIPGTVGATITVPENPKTAT